MSRVVFLSLALSFVLIPPALAVSWTYPLNLRVAVAKEYAPARVTVTKTCQRTYDGKDLYAVAWVKRSDGSPSKTAFQFINTAGWFAMWRDGHPTAGVPPDQRNRVKQILARLATTCGT